MKSRKHLSRALTVPVLAFGFALLIASSAQATHTVVSINPKFGNNTGSVQITFTGSGFGGATGAKLTRSGQPAILSSSHSVGSGGTSLLATFDLTAAAPGAWVPHVVKSTEGISPDATCPPTTCDFTIAATPPTVLAVNPTSRGQGAQNELITVAGSDFARGDTVSFSHASITVDSTQFISQIELRATVDVAGSVPAGAYHVTVTHTNGDNDVCEGCFTVNPAPSITSVSPNSRGRGAQDQQLTISGANFQTGATVTFPGTGITIEPNSTIVENATTIKTTVDIATNATLGARQVTVTNGDGATPATCSTCFSVNVAPAPTSVAPTNRGQGGQNQDITIVGTNFVSGITASDVSFGSGITVESVTFENTSQLTARIDIDTEAATGSRSISVTNPDKGVGSCSNCFTVNPKPTVTSISPSSRAQGAASQPVTVTGTNFQNGLTLTFDQGIVVNSIDATSVTSTSFTANITVDNTADVRVHTLSVLNPDGGAAGVCACFTVNPKPTVSTPTPAALGQGATTRDVVIPGTGFQSGATVAFAPTTGITIHSTNVDTSNQTITVNVSVANNATSSRTIVVTNPDQGVGQCACFNINSAPQVNGATPSSRGAGAQNQTVTINGTGFSGTPTVAFSGAGISHTVTGATATSITLNLSITSAAATGQRNITVTNPDFGVHTCNNCFEVNPAPSPNEATPPTLSRGQTANVEIEGGNFIDGATVTFDDPKITVNNTTFNDPPVLDPSITVNVTVAADAATGQKRFTVRNPDGGVGACTTCLSVVFSPATLRANDPVLPASGGQGAQNREVKIHGTNFATTEMPTVSISGDGVSVVSGTVSVNPEGTELTARINIGQTATPGARNVSVTNPGSTAASCTGCFTVNLAPNPGSTSPSSRGQNAANQNITINAAAPPSTFTNGAQVAFSGEGITVNSVTFNDVGVLDTLTANVTLAAGATPGQRTITVTNPDGGIGQCVNCFTVTLAPAVTEVAPASRGAGALNQTLTLTGANFVATPTVTFSGGDITLDSTELVNPTTVRVVIDVPANAASGQRNVTVTNPDAGTVTCTGCFTVNPAPTISTVAPASRGQGATDQDIVLTGTGFQAGLTPSSLVFSGTGITIDSVTRNSDTQVTVRLDVASNATTGARNLTLTNPDAGPAVCTGCFTINAGPTTSGVTPAFGGNTTASQKITIDGGSFVNGAGLSVRLQRTGQPDIVASAVTFVSASKLEAFFDLRGAAPLDRWVLRVTNPDGGSTTTCGDATCFAIAGSLPTFTGVSPSSRGQGATNQVLTLTGNNFARSATVTFSGSGITVNSATYNSPTSYAVNITIANDAATGPRNVTFTNADSQAAVCSGCFTVGSAPLITTVSPSARGQGAQNQSVQIDGSGFSSAIVKEGVSFGPGITIDTLTRNSFTRLTAVIDVDPTAPVGAHTLSVSNPDGGTTTCTTCFSVNAAPVVSNVTPSSRGQGASKEPVTLGGSGFVPQMSIVFSGTGIIAGQPAITATEVTIDVTVGQTAQAGPRSITLTNPDGGTSTCTGCFTVNAKPSVSGVNPSSLLAGSENRQVVITGANFLDGATVSFGQGITVDSVDHDAVPGQLTAVIDVAENATSGPRTLTVTNLDGGTPATCSNCFSIAPGPSLTGISPSSRGQGATDQQLVLTGTFFADGATIGFGDGISVDPDSVVVDSPTQITLEVDIEDGATPGVRTVTVENLDGGIATCQCFTVNAKPAATSSSPNAGGQGADDLLVRVLGTGFLGTPTVDFGDGVTHGPVTRVSATELRTLVDVADDATPGPRNITVQNADGSPAVVCTACFNVNAKPILSAVSPNARGQGATNQTLTLTGTGFAPTPTVTFGGSGITVQPGGITHLNPTTLTVLVSVDPSAPLGPRDVTLVNPDGGAATCEECFLVSTRPTITSVSPSTAAAGTTSNLIVNGLNFTSSPTVTFAGGDVTVNSVTVNNASRMTVNVTVGTGGVPGPRAITVVNDDAGTFTCPACLAVFRALEENGSGATYFWRNVGTSSAYGGSYRVEHLAGATARYTFTGSSVTWYTVLGPNQGTAVVKIDDVTKGTYNNYSSRTTYRAARTFSGLGSGTHTITITATGLRGNSRGTDSQVAVDAFKAGSGAIANTPSVVYGWRRTSSSVASGGSVATTNLAGSITQLSFRGGSVETYLLRGPNQGVAWVYVNGVLRSKVDLYATSFSVRRLAYGGLDRTKSSLIRVVVMGTRNSRSSGTNVSIDRWIVR